MKKGTEATIISSAPETENNSSDVSSSEDESNSNIPRGQPKSGRFWKSRKTRTRTLVQTPGLRMSFEERMKLRHDLAYNKSLSREVKEQKKKQREQKRLRTKINLKKREENSRKAEVVQIIKDPKKIKRMKKKTLRTIEKRDTLNLKGQSS